MTHEEELALEALRHVEWTGDDNGFFACGVCGRIEEDGHSTACSVGKALDALRAKEAAGSSKVAVDQEEGPVRIGKGLYMLRRCGDTPRE